MQIEIEANVIFNNKFNFYGIYARKTIYVSNIYDNHTQLTGCRICISTNLKCRQFTILQLKLFLDNQRVFN